MVTYVTYHYRLTPWLIECNIYYLMQLELFFKVGYVCTIPKGMERNTIVLSLQSKYYALDSTGCNEMGDYFAIEADTMIDIVRVT